MKPHRARRFAQRAAVALAVTIVVFYAAVYFVPLSERIDPPFSTTVSYADAAPAHVFLADDDRWRIESSHRDVDPDYIEALIELEDRRFFEHPGVDPLAVVRAAGSNLTSRRVVSGASTITMQVVRMAEPRPRTLRSKVVESFRAIQLERHFGKYEILDMYLNLLPFGDNYEGLETATQVYFGQDASNLDAAQIATLLAVPQAPHLRTPSPQNETQLRVARDEIAQYLFDRDALPRGMRSDRIGRREAMEFVEQTPVPIRITPMPRDIPHLARQLQSQYPDSNHLVTTVDRTTQSVVEGMVQNHRSTVERLGGDHAAAVVVDHRTGELKAAVGNFAFGSGESGQNIAAYDVPRSTGSLLKPFLLARAIDRGEATPSQRVSDIPVDYGGYRPQNFDGTFDGLVRLDDALQRSLNVPFVDLLRDIGVDDFLMLLQRVGASYPQGPPEDHGLSYAVGGIDATPMEVATMFSSLARRGDAVDIQRLKGDPNPGSTVVNGAMTPEATWMVRQIMRGRDRPGFPGRLALYGGLSRYGWKTGTSMGFRDAWTAGFGPRHVVVVWTGNLDYRPSYNLIGEQAAAPLFFDIIEAVDSTDGRGYEPPPEGIDTVEVCSFSGHLPTAACDHTHDIHHPRQSIPTEPCPYHVEVEVDVESGQAVTPACRGDRQVEAETFLRLPAPVRSFFDLRGESQDSMPDYAPECRIRRTASGPAVSSPPDDTVISLMPGVPVESQQIPLEATGDGGSLDWFVNGRFIDRVDDGERIWWEPEPGTWEFVVSDGAGNSVQRVIEVE